MVAGKTEKAWGLGKALNRKVKGLAVNKTGKVKGLGPGVSKIGMALVMGPSKMAKELEVSKTEMVRVRELSKTVTVPEQVVSRTLLVRELVPDSSAKEHQLAHRKNPGKNQSQRNWGREGTLAQTASLLSEGRILSISLGHHSLAQELGDCNSVQEQEHYNLVKEQGGCS